MRKRGAISPRRDYHGLNNHKAIHQGTWRKRISTSVKRPALQKPVMIPYSESCSVTALIKGSYGVALRLVLDFGAHILY